MSIIPNDPLLQVETTCGSLLYELQIIWDEVGETDAERDKMLFELEQECLEVYRRKMDCANRSRAQLRQAIADSQAELAAICSAMGERPVYIRQSDQKPGNLKEELKQIIPQLDEMRKKIIDRRNQFFEVLEQIERISKEIHSSDYKQPKIVVNEADISLRKLEDLHRQLQALQNEKTDRLKLLQDHLYTLRSLCSVLGIDFKHIVDEVHPSLGNSEGPKNITTKTIEGLAAATENLREIKLERMQRLQDLAATMLDLWDLMDTPIEEQQMFQNITSNIASFEHDITEPNTLSLDCISFVEAEVCRLEELKSSKMKEFILKKRSELEEVCRQTHLVPEEDTSIEHAIEAIESGAMDSAFVLEQIEIKICKAKEEALMRKEILEKVEKWLHGCDEECWLEEYNRDDNRYNAGRGAHLALKRAEKARSLSSKLPGMVEALASKTIAWEEERRSEFTYDGVRLLSMLEDYNMLRQEKEQELRRQRDQKKLQGQLLAEQEALFGSKPSPSKPQSMRKGPKMSTGGASNRRVSLGGAMFQTPKHDHLLHTVKATPHSRAGRKSEKLQLNDQILLQDGGFGALSAGRRGLDIADLPLKKLSSSVTSAREIEATPHFRKPLSPISSKEQPQQIENNLNSQSMVPAENLPCSTPLKRTSITDEVEKTPKPKPKPNPVPSTPSTVSIPMQTSITPAPPPPLMYLTAQSSKEECLEEEIEYSFEERRAGFVLPRAHHIKAIQV